MLQNKPFNKYPMMLCLFNENLKKYIFFYKKEIILTCNTTQVVIAHIMLP